MLTIKKKPPATQRRFVHPWMELDYLRKKVRFWLYARKDKGRAVRYAKRLQRVLGQVPQDDLAIIQQEGLALLGELTGDLRGSIVHRKKEIELIERLHREARLPRYSEKTRVYMLQDLNEAALQERREILKSLMRQNTEVNGKAK